MSPNPSETVPTWPGSGCDCGACVGAREAYLRWERARRV